MRVGHAGAWSAVLLIAASAAVGCSSQPSPVEVQDAAYRVLIAAQTSYNQLSPSQQRLLCRDYQGTLPASRDSDADAVRADVALSPEMMRSALGLQPEAFPRIAEQALEEVLAAEC